MAKIALFGATGAVGGSIASVLRNRGQSYRVVGRDRIALARHYGRDSLAEIVGWNPHDPDSVKTAASGVDTIIYLVGGPYWEPGKHPDLMRKTIDGAVAAGVEKIVLGGTVFPFGVPQTPRVSRHHPRVPNTHKGRMRKLQEDILMEADMVGKVRATVLRLPDFFGPGLGRSVVADVFRAAHEDRPVKMVGPIDTDHEFIYVPDAGQALVQLSENEKAYGQTWNLGGPGVITQRDFALRAFQDVGTKPVFSVTNKFTLRVMGLINPVMRQLADISYLHHTPVILDDADVLDLLPGFTKTSYEAGILATMISEGSRRH